jgi:2-polyprenyl-6-methoxyphenol hydroxylase-like FAD-dependent oxidoreductase
MDLMNQRIDTILSSYDVVVVGARAAGASTAMLLARQGLTTLAIDRGAYGADTLSTHSLAPAGVLQLSRWGVLDEIRRAGTPVAKTVRFHYGDDEVAVDVRPRGDVDGLYSPRRTVLDAALVDAAIAAGADVRHGVTMVRLTTDGAGRADGVELDVNGRRRTVRARYVVGADGLRSRVARQVGAPVIHREPAAATSLFAYFDGLPQDTIENFVETDRVVGVIPTNDGLACVWVGMARERFERVVRGRAAVAHAAEIASVPELGAALRGRAPRSGYRTFAGASGQLRRAWGPGWALVGDAGYFKDPLSAHGITDAFIGAELLADALTKTLVDGCAAEQAMGEYQRVRDEMARQMMPPVATVASFPGDMVVVKQAYRDMSRAMRDEFALVESTFGAAVAA